MNQKNVLKKLRNDLVKLDRKQKYLSFYNIRYKVLSLLLRMGIFVDFCFPFVASGMVLFFAFPGNNKPFVVDKVRVVAKRVVMDDSLGFHQDIVGFDFDNRNELKYSDGWFVNKYGLYERNVTSYDVGKVNLDDTSVIFDMSKEELDNNYNISSVEKIQQIVLNDKDSFYNEPVISIISVFDFPAWSINEMESDKRNFIITVGYLLISISIGCVVYEFKQDYVKKYLECKLENLKIRNEYLDIDSDVDFDKIKTVMEDNLELVNEKKLVR